MTRSKRAKSLAYLRTEVQNRIKQVQQHTKPSRYVLHAAKSQGKLETLQWALLEIKKVLAYEARKAKRELAKRERMIERLKLQVAM